MRANAESCICKASHLHMPLIFIGTQCPNYPLLRLFISFLFITISHHGPIDGGSAEADQG